MIKVYKTRDYQEMSKKAAGIIASLLTLKEDAVLGLATGSSPVGTYKCLIEKCKAGEISFKRVKSANLDEYVGLPITHDQSYRYFMNDNLFNHVDIDIQNTNVPDGLAKDPTKEGKRYDKLVADLGGADLQLLGLGHDGHIGFNEPCDSFPVGTHVVELTDMTKKANARFFENDPEKVPSKAITMGIGTIMSAKKILLVVSGEDKADIVKEALLGPVTPRVPASILQFHGDVTVVADEKALASYIKAGGELCG